MTVQRPDTRAWDLSRLHDRVKALDAQLEDMAVSKVGDELDLELGGLCGDVANALDSVRFHLEQRLGSFENYQAADS